MALLSSQLAVYQTLSIECRSYIFFWHVLCFIVLSLCRFCFCFHAHVKAL